MSVKLKITEPGGIYFIAITCFKWHSLFNIADSFPVDNIMEILDIDLRKEYNIFPNPESPL